jgi:hypothetical protein
MTTYIDPVKTMLEQNFPDANGLWNYSSDTTSATSVSKELATGQSQRLEENNALTDNLTKASDDVTSQEEEDRPFEVED